MQAELPIDSRNRNSSYSCNYACARVLPLSGPTRCSVRQIAQSPLAFTQEFERPGMEAQQTASMTDADQGCGRQRFAQQPIHRMFQSFVHCGTGFVQED